MHSCCSERRMWWLWSLCLIFFSLSNTILVVASSSSPVKHLCLPDQKDALLEFKNEFYVGGLYMYDYGVQNKKTETWENDTDCCSWGGVSCDPKTGKVVELSMESRSLNGPLRSNSSLFRLQYLQSLNLRFNHISGILPHSIGSFKYLEVLDLRYCKFFGKIPSSLGNLSLLTDLDLSGNDFTGELPNSMGNLNRLTTLNLGTTKLSGNFPLLLLNLSELTTIKLRSSQFEGKLPSNMSSLSKLEYFEINENSFSGSVPSSLFMIPSLKELDLSRNNFNGPIPGSILKLVGLQRLDLSFWNTEKGIVNFSIFSHLTSLEELDLSGINLKISSTLHLPLQLYSLGLSSCNIVEFPKFLQNQTSLIILDISANHIEGQVPEWLWSLPELIDVNISQNFFTGFEGSSDVIQRSVKLYLLDISSNAFQNPFPLLPKSMRCFLGSDNQFSGEIPQTICELVSLRVLFLSNNNFSGPIPGSISKLVGLQYLHLSFWNTEKGIVDFSIFSHLTSLEFLDLSGINLKISSTLHLPLPIVYLTLSSCNIVEFPKFLQNQTSLSYLDISANHIEGQVPEWLWSLPELELVNISQNFFTGFEGSSDVIQRSVKLYMLDISSNAFQNPFPLLPNSMEYFLGSDNQFSGEIPQTICELVSLQVLFLSNNNFSGSIPRCFQSFNTSLLVLHLRNNSLSGVFPEETISDTLISFDVGLNRLSGKLPKSLIRCTDLVFLNVEDNKFNDEFPFWLRLLPKLQFLVLRSNEFHGPISSHGDSLSFVKLRIFDISRNRFTGVLPSDYFLGWSAMSSVVGIATIGGGSYHYSVSVVNKGSNMVLVWSSFTLYKTIDVSGNRFQGNIPESIGLLKGLIVLNMSNNAFAGHIPPSLANLTNLESLDLSRNALSGKIPPELGKLTFLSRMNFSNNRLEGPIPQSTEIQSQNNSSFVGNLGLCGAPLEETCGGGAATTQHQDAEDEESDEVISWIAAAIACVPGILFGLTIGHILNSYKSDWFMRIFHSCV